MKFLKKHLLTVLAVLAALVAAGYFVAKKWPAVLPAFLVSDEDFVAALYSKYLGNPNAKSQPTSGLATYWVPRLKSGVSRAQMDKEFRTSPNAVAYATAHGLTVYTS